MSDSLCNEAFSSITDSSALDFFPFSLYELSSVGKIDLKIVAYTDFAGGYAKHGRDLVEYLDNCGQFNVKLEKLKSNVNVDPFVYNYFDHLTKTKIDEDNFIEIVIGAPGHLERLRDSKAKYTIGYTMAETQEVPEKFRLMCSWCDELFLPTKLDVLRFSKLEKDNLIKLTHMPLWVDCSKYRSNLKKAKLVNVPKNNFVFMFNGTWNKRKGVHEILEAFINEFNSNDNVSLVMMTRYGTTPYHDGKRSRIPENKTVWNMKWEYDYLLKETGLDKKKDKPHVCILDVPIHDSIFPNFMANANVCVAASRGESTWLPGLEFGAMGIPSIQTAWGGHLDYLKLDNSYLTNFDGFEKCDNELIEGTSDYCEDAEMACLSVQSIQKSMRSVVENKFYVERKGRKLRKLIKSQYDKSKNLENVKNRIIQIESELGEK